MERLLRPLAVVLQGADSCGRLLAPFRQRELPRSRGGVGHERLARAHLDLLGPLGDELEVLAGAGREQRDLLEVIDEDVVASHGAGI